MKEFYRGREVALWNNLIPKLNEGDGNSTDLVNQLDNAEDMSTFDDPTRLISKFRSIFPSPPPPPYTPPYKNEPIQSEQGAQVTESSFGMTVEYSETTEKSFNRGKNTEIFREDTHEPVSHSREPESNNVPLSVVIVVGCTLLFINLCLFVGMYVQRKRIAKLKSDPRNHQPRSGASGNMHVNDNRNSDIYPHGGGGGGPPEAVSLMQAQDMAQAKRLATINHKSPTDGPPVYTAISKPVSPPAGPGGYSYSALSQKSSPMHTQSKPQTTTFSHVNPPPASVASSDIGAASESGSEASRGSNPNVVRNPGPDRSPKLDPRTKHAPRGNHTMSSNNAITIV